MASMKLVNNTGLESEKNLCFVNTELQLLYSISDVKDFFALKQYRENCTEKLPLCDELSRIFLTAGMTYVMVFNKTWKNFTHCSLEASMMNLED